MIAFLDTEFTGLGPCPQLLSVGIVLGLGDGREFYAEVTDADRLEAATDFVVDTVLPQFGKIAGAGCGYAELSDRLHAFLVGISPPRQNEGSVDVAFNSDIDWMLVAQALRSGGERDGLRIRPSLRPVNIYNMRGFAAGELAANRYYATQSLAPIHRHHALCDARALRVAYAAAAAESSMPLKALSA